MSSASWWVSSSRWVRSTYGGTASTPSGLPGTSWGSPIPPTRWSFLLMPDPPPATPSLVPGPSLVLPLRDLLPECPPCLAPQLCHGPASVTPTPRPSSPSEKCNSYSTAFVYILYSTLIPTTTFNGKTSRLPSPSTPTPCHSPST